MSDKSTCNKVPWKLARHVVFFFTCRCPAVINSLPLASFPTCRSNDAGEGATGERLARLRAGVTKSRVPFSTTIKTVCTSPSNVE